MATDSLLGEEAWNAIAPSIADLPENDVADKPHQRRRAILLQIISLIHGVVSIFPLSLSLAWECGACVCNSSQLRGLSCSRGPGCPPALVQVQFIIVCFGLLTREASPFFPPRLATVTCCEDIQKSERNPRSRGMCGHHRELRWRPSRAPSLA